MFLSLTAPTRGRFYQVVFSVLVVAVAHGALTESEAMLWLGVAGAVLGNGLAVINARTARRWLYGIVLAVQPAVIYLGLVTSSQAALWVGVAAAVLGVGTAMATTPAWPTWIDTTGRDEASQILQTNNGPRPHDGAQPEEPTR